ncbi:MAG: hypothetical protein WCP93_00980 [Candidatus Berkelbacteria bacterium]
MDDPILTDDIITIDWQKVDEANAIRDEICAKPWDELKKNPVVLAKTFSEEFEVTPAEMIMMDEAELLDSVFEHADKIPEENKTALINLYKDYNFHQDVATIQNDYQSLAPEINFHENLDLEKTQNQAKRVSQGLENLRLITFYKEAEDLTIETNALKTVSAEREKLLFDKVDQLLKMIKAATDEKRQLNINEINEIIEFESKFGRNSVGLEDLKEETDPLVYLTVVQKNRKALMVLAAADREDLRENLGDAFTVANLIEKYRIE